MASWMTDILPKLTAAADLQAEYPWHHEVWNGCAVPPPSRGDLEYDHENDPFKLMGPKARAICFERLSRLHAEDEYGLTTDADRQLDIRGYELGKQQRSHDFCIYPTGRQLSGAHEVRKMEVKSARLHWVRQCRKWGIVFRNIKPAEFDCL
eukprot:4215376-Amphidinium_carterae.1